MFRNALITIIIPLSFKSLITYLLPCYATRVTRYLLLHVNFS
jgi:hypothetical protein